MSLFLLVAETFYCTVTIHEETRDSGSMKLRYSISLGGGGRTETMAR